MHQRQSLMISVQKQAWTLFPKTRKRSKHERALALSSTLKLCKHRPGQNGQDGALHSGQWGELSAGQTPDGAFRYPRRGAARSSESMTRVNGPLLTSETSIIAPN